VPEPDSPEEEHLPQTPAEGDEPVVEEEETLKMSTLRWSALWGVPAVVVIVVFVVVVHLAG